MAKTTITATTDMKELASDLYSLADALPEDVLIAGEEQLKVFRDAVKTNWLSMVPYSFAGDYVYDSIGYNVDHGDGADVVGMGGVFHMDAVKAAHDKTDSSITAPQLAYWVEYGFTPNNATPVPARPFLSNAFYMTYNQQDYVFAEALSKQLSKRLKNG